MVFGLVTVLIYSGLLHDLVSVRRLVRLLGTPALECTSLFIMLIYNTPLSSYWLHSFFKNLNTFLRNTILS